MHGRVCMLVVMHYHKCVGARTYDNHVTFCGNLMKSHNVYAASYGYVECHIKR